MIRDLSNIVGTIDPESVEYRQYTIDWRLNSRESFKSDQLRLIRIGKGQGSWKERNDPENRASSLARLSPRLPRRREFMRHLFVVDSLDKHIQNEKELIRPRRILPAARATRARSAQFYVVLICNDSTGVGGLFCICVESIDLT